MSRLFVKKYWKVFLLVLLTITFGIPLIGATTAFFLSGFKSVFIETNAEWLTFYSALVGGVISGSLTLGGVLLTLKHQVEREQYRNRPILRIEEFTGNVEEAQVISYCPPVINAEDHKENKLVNNMSYIKENIRFSFTNIGKSYIKHFGIRATAFSNDLSKERFNTLAQGEERIIELEVVIPLGEADEYDNFEDDLIVYFSDYDHNYYYTTIKLSYMVINKTLLIIYQYHTETKFTTRDEIRRITDEIRKPNVKKTRG